MYWGEFLDWLQVLYKGVLNVIGNMGGEMILPLPF